MKNNNNQVAIDGPAAAGKSTVAKFTAEKLGAIYINTGDMYRALTWELLQRGIDPETAPEKAAAELASLDISWYCNNPGNPTLFLNNQPMDSAKVRSPEVAEKVSFTARIAEVRQWLIQRQREPSRLGMVVMEGRDIGTVVFPEAEHKFFLTASAEVRARRRLAQPGEVAPGATVESVTEEIKRRDKADQNRPIAPLRPAPDAEIINTDNLTIEQVADLITQKIKTKEKLIPIE